MSYLIDRIAHADNLRWAWKKAKNAYQIGDIWFDEIELAAFEADLFHNLKKISDEIKSGSFRVSDIKPIPYPKSLSLKGKPRTRQTFYISIKDQVVWLAVVNVIGAELDYRMPSWSYGNRLYVSVWYDQSSDGKKELKVGWYRNTSGFIYRKWNQSWPLFRRHISLATKIMTKAGKFNKKYNDFIEDELNEELEVETINNNNLLAPYLKVQYLEKDYWADRTTDKLYWVSLDLEKFYPRIKLDIIEKNILKFIPPKKQDAEFISLVSNLLKFPIDRNGWTIRELTQLQIETDSNSELIGIPTGLFVAGFLANVALLEVDEKIQDLLNSNKEIAHFRFVDDHIILSYDFEKMVKWVRDYKVILESLDTGATFNYEKIEPISFSEYLRNETSKTKKKRAIKDTLLDPRYPSPLMTLTLAKVSAIGKTDFEILSESEENQLVSDLEYLLLTDFPDNELKKDTRISFAATMLSRIIPKKRYDYSQIYSIRKSMSKIVSKVETIEISELLVLISFGVSSPPLAA